MIGLDRGLSVGAVVASVAAVGTLVGACGPSVRTAGLADVTGARAPAATEAFLVQVMERPPARPARRVSISVATLSRAVPAPPAPDAHTREAMRAQAGARGAQVLVLSRLDTPWRKAFYGVGYRYLPPGAQADADDDDERAAPPPCGQPDAVEAINDARAEALRCMGEARRARPALEGRVEILFDVDAFGDVMRAAATPASSRDGALQRCALRAVFHQDYGRASAVVCRAALRVELGREEAP